MVPEGVDICLQPVDFIYNKSSFYNDVCTLNAMVLCTKKCGSISITGSDGDYNNNTAMPINIMMEKNLKFNATQSPTQKYWYICLEQVRLGTINPKLVISCYFSIDELSKYYEQVIDEEGLKCFIGLKQH
jgi:threonine dehydrogenase-like Zn-dependent dehydrogenase